MRGADVISFKIENEVRLNSILHSALCRAIIESPFYHTINSIFESVHANFERNVALGLFREYARGLQVNLNWKPSTKFHEVNYDFEWNEYSFLIMNKTIRNAKAFNRNQYVLLPALVPNRFQNDRWTIGQADAENSKSSFVFTFLDMENQTSNYYETIQPELETWLSILKRRFSKSPISHKPFEEEWFWKEATRRGGVPQLRNGLNPSLVITGVCLPEYHQFFSDTDGISEFAYALYTGKWYDVKSPGVLSFCNGVILSKFKNATCPMAALPSFSEVIRGC